MNLDIFLFLSKASSCFGSEAGVRVSNTSVATALSLPDFLSAYKAGMGYDGESITIESVYRAEERACTVPLKEFYGYTSQQCLTYQYINYSLLSLVFPMSLEIFESMR